MRSIKEAPSFRKLQSIAQVVLTVGGRERQMSFGEFTREYMTSTNDTDYALLQEGCLLGNRVPVGCVDPSTPLGTLRLA